MTRPRHLPSPSRPAALPLAASLAATLLAGVAALPVQAASVGDRTSVTMTLYQSGPALIEDQRAVTLDKGPSRLTFGTVSNGLIPPSLRVAPINGQSFTVREQSWQPARPLMPELLRAYEGKTVTILRTVDGREVTEQAKVLRAEPEPVFEIGGKIRVGMPGTLLFDGLPETVALTPSLTVETDAAAAGSGVAALRYLSSGLSWSADHVLDLSADSTSAHLTTSATLVNTTGQTWPNIRLALVAGEVETSYADSRPMPMARGRGVVMAAAPMMEKAMDMPEREAFGAVHLYSVPQTVTLRQDEVRQIALLQASAVPAKVSYAISGAGNQSNGDAEPVPQAIPAFLTLTNSAKTGPGQPVPGGSVRIYQSDAKGQARLLGSTALPDLPVDGSARLPLGKAFDLTAAGRMTKMTRIGERTQETSHSITLHNAGAKDATVDVLEPMGGDWKITAESVRGKRLDGSTAQWSLPVPAGKSVTMTYTVRTTY